METGAAGEGLDGIHTALANVPKTSTAANGPRFIEPMHAMLVTSLPGGDEWLYEVKLDGYRALAVKDGDTVRLLSRRSIDLTDDYPRVASAVRRIHAHAAILDGEIVAVDDQRRPSFQALQYRHRPQHADCVLRVRPAACERH